MGRLKQNPENNQFFFHSCDHVSLVKGQSRTGKELYSHIEKIGTELGNESDSVVRRKEIGN